MRISKSGIMKLKTVSLLCVGSVLLCGILACSNQAKQSTEENNDEQQLFIGDNIAVAQTQYGKVKAIGNQHWSLYFHEVTASKEVSDLFNNLRALDKYVLAVLVHDKVYISLTITGICLRYR